MTTPPEMVHSNAAWSRFLRSLALAANQLAADLSYGPSGSASPHPSPDALVRGARHKAIVAVAGLRSADGVATADVGRAVGLAHSYANVYGALRALEKRGIVELVPDRNPQRWRLVEALREEPIP